jgi:hypothetical protein
MVLDPWYLLVGRNPQREPNVSIGMAFNSTSVEAPHRSRDAGSIDSTPTSMEDGRRRAAVLLLAM